MGTIMAPTPDPSARHLLHLLQVSDASFPTGAYAHSLGLEGLVHAEVVRDATSLEAYLLEHALPALARGELPFVAHAHAAGSRGDLDRVVELDAWCHALRGARELRDASTRIGAQRVQMAAQLQPDAWPRRLDEARQAGRWRAHAPVAFGALCGGAGVPEDAAVAAYAYQQLGGAAAASMKLLRIGQVAVQQMLTRLLEQAAPALAGARALALEDAGWFAPVVDIASARHETSYTRLFIS